MNLGRIEQYHNPNEGREIINSAFESIEQTVTGGTSSIITAATLDNLSVSATTSLNILSATTIFSGGTNLFDIFSGTTGNPGGNDTEVQFNSNGSFSGSPYLRYLSASKSLNVGSTNISGATSAGFNLENLNGSIKIGGDDTNLFGGIITSTYASNTFQPAILMLRSLGTTASPTAIMNNNSLGNITFGGYDGTTWKISKSSSIQVYSVGNWNSGETATKMELSIIPTGKTTSERILTLQHDGNSSFKYGIIVGDIIAGTSVREGTIRYASNKFQGYEPAGWFNLNPTQLWVSGSGFSSILVNNSNNSASGDYSIAGGNLSSTKGYASIAIGQSLITSGKSSFGIGGLLNFTSTNGMYGGVLGGRQCYSDAEGAVIIGCSGVTASTEYTTYVNKLNIHYTETPLSGASGESGTMVWDDDYIYIRTNKDGGRWGRIPIEYDF